MQTQNITTGLTTVLDRFLASPAGRQAVAEAEAAERATRVNVRRDYDEAIAELERVAPESASILEKQRRTVSELETKLATARAQLVQTESERMGLHLTIERRRDVAERTLRESAPAEIVELFETVNASLHRSRTPVINFEGRTIDGRNIVTSNTDEICSAVTNLRAIRDALMQLQIEVDPDAPKRFQAIRSKAEPLLAFLR